MAHPHQGIPARPKWASRALEGFKFSLYIFVPIITTLVITRPSFIEAGLRFYKPIVYPPEDDIESEKLEFDRKYGDKWRQIFEAAASSPAPESAEGQKR
jgi:hypothetical protein